MADPTSRSGRMPRCVALYELSPHEVGVIEGLVDRISSRVSSAEDTSLLRRAPRLVSRLSPGLLHFLERFRSSECAAAVVVSGFPVDQRKIGPTPSHWSAQPDARSTLREEIYFVLAASMLGEPFAWSTLQRGRVIHNVIPIAGEETQQSGHGSTATLAWHTEDGFHPFRCDYLALMALRNHERVPTTITSVDRVSLAPDDLRVLFEPRFVIRTDDEHVRQGAAREPYFYWSQPDPVSVLFGDPHAPYLRIDPTFMTPRPGDEAARRALDALIRDLEAGLDDLVLVPGDVCFIDNFRAAHGRRSFPAKYDGADRWLKKIGVTRDLRRSRSARDAADSRVVATEWSPRARSERNPPSCENR